MAYSEDILRQIEGLDEEIRLQLMPKSANPKHVLSVKEKQIIVVGLALKKRTKDIVKEINEWRINNNLKPIPIQGLSYKIGYYRNRYRDLIKHINQKYYENISQIATYADKANRILKMNDFVFEALEYLEDQKFGTKEHKETLGLILRLFNAINEEMGKPKFKFIQKEEHKIEDKKITITDLVKEKNLDITDIVGNVLKAKYSERIGQS